MTTNGLTVAEARELMQAWVASPALRVHMESVAACMTEYATTVDPAHLARWTVCGLLHDFDYERHPTPEEHPHIGVQHLRSLGVDDEILDAIMGHASYTGTPRISAMARHLFAVDELAGFIVACGKVRPDGLASLEPASVKKKLKTATFAAAVSRADIDEGAREVGAADGPAFESHVARCIAAIRSADVAQGVARVG
ncbi:MAG: HDIG domain-containing protein [Phycisphaerae bacterium]|nr:HDIG domain-containing protein [Phycisphaerae bacterium]